MTDHEHMPKDPFDYCPLCADMVGDLVLKAMTADEADIVIVVRLGSGVWRCHTFGDDPYDFIEQFDKMKEKDGC